MLEKYDICMNTWHNKKYRMEVLNQTISMGREFTPSKL